jgi:hypothetical protein
VNRDSSVGITTGYGLDGGGGVDFRQGQDNFFFSIASRTALWPNQPPVQKVLGAASTGVKRQGREADHSPPSSAEIKTEGISPLPIRLHGVGLN